MEEDYTRSRLKNRSPKPYRIALYIGEGSMKAAYFFLTLFIVEYITGEVLTRRYAGLHPILFFLSILFIFILAGRFIFGARITSERAEDYQEWKRTRSENTVLTVTVMVIVFLSSIVILVADWPALFSYLKYLTILSLGMGVILFIAGGRTLNKEMEESETT